MLCSYENVGAARARIRAHPAAAGGAARWVALELRWASRSSQQCVFRVGTAPAGAHVLELGPRRRLRRFDEPRMHALPIYNRGMKA